MIRKVLVLGIVAGFASLLHGCYSENCLETATCPPMPEGEAPTCDPAEGGIHEECPGVFVSSTRGDDENIGTRDQPVRSLAKAIDAARLGPRRIYACGEVFEESVIIPAGVEVWGGLGCAAGWGYVGESAKTTILGAPNEIPVRFVAGAGRASLADVHVEAGHATTPGGSSIAVLIGSEAAVDIFRSELVAGNGARGADGTSGGAQRAADGAAGSPGGAACSTITVQGGAGAINSCRGYDSVGGLGGWGPATSVDASGEHGLDAGVQSFPVA